MLKAKFFESHGVKRVLLCCAFLLIISGNVLAKDKKIYQGELFLITLPPQWYHASNEPELKNGVMHIMPPNLDEFVPKGETVDNWTQMLSREVFKGLKGIDPEWYLMEMNRKITEEECPGQVRRLTASGVKNGYAEAFAQADCPLGEITLYKAVQGRDSFYVVWRSYRVPPFPKGRPPPISPKLIYDGFKYLEEHVKLCDLRIAGSCPPEVEDHPERY